MKNGKTKMRKVERTRTRYNRFEKRILNLLLLSALFWLASGCMNRGETARSEIDKIKRDFVAPGDSNTVWCYWYWINDDISKEGITKDLEAMKKVGIGTAFIGNINPPEVDGPVPILSEHWWECMVHAVNEGKRIGIDIGTFNSPGWSQSGGPWVKPEMAMRHLVYSDVNVKGPGKVKVHIPQPKELFQDVYVIAFPAVQAEKTKLTDANSKISSTPLIDNIGNLMDGDTATVANFRSDENEYTIEIKSGEKINARSITLYPGKGRFAADCELFALLDGKFQSIRSFPFDRSNISVNVGPDVYGPVSIALPGVSSGTFRLICRRNNKQWNSTSGFAEIKISEAPVLEHFVEKKLGKMFPSPLPLWNSYIWENQENIESADLKIDAARVIDISDKMDSGGQLIWEVPEGEWTVMRFGMTPTGTKNSPSAPQGKGYEIDKASEKIARIHFDNYVGELLKRVPEENRSALKYVVADSYEQGSQNWTDNFDRLFKEKYGYDIREYLPVFAGRIVNSAEESNRFLWDLRRLVADEVAYQYVGGLRKVCDENNLKLWLENYGHWGFPSEFLMYGGQSHLVSGEFWNEGTLGDIECKSASSAAHIYGKPVVSAEAFTASGKAFLRHPAMLKKRGDWSFTEGINHFVLHLYIHQPDDSRIPGINAWFGTEFNRHNTWFEHSKTWIDYIRRSQHLLQQGKYVADVCYFIGEDAPMMTGVRIPELPAGYSFDYINAEIILSNLTVKDGKFVLPDGTSYKIMVLPPVKTMRPRVLAKIEDLVKQGGVIFGQAPENSPGLAGYPDCDKQVRTFAEKLWGAEKEKETGFKKYGKGYVLDETDLLSALETFNVYRDVDVDGESSVLWTHRKSQDMEIYFLTNQSDEVLTFNPSFRVAGMKPQLWDAVTGEIRNLNEYKVKDGRTVIPVKMESHQSWFIVFTNRVDNVNKGYNKNFPELKKIHTIDGAWTVDFQNKRFGPVNPVKFDSLTDWSLSNDEKIKFYSGTAVYETKFELKEMPQNNELFIDFGEIHVMAKVKLNGADVGGIWMKPYRLRVTDHLIKGVNQIEVEVVNLWRNHLIRDKNLPEDQRSTWQLVNDLKEGEHLQRSGLLGPVTIQEIVP